MLRSLSAAEKMRGERLSLMGRLKGVSKEVSQGRRTMMRRTTATPHGGLRTWRR